MANNLRTYINGSGGSSSGSSSAVGGGVIVGYEVGSYTFDASAQTVTFSGLGTVSLTQVLKILNITDGIIIYDPNNPDTGGTMSSNVLTLDYDTTTMSDSDELQIIIQYNNSADYSTGSDLVSVLNPVYTRYTDPETLVTAQDLTASYADYGAEIDMRGYTHLRVAIVSDVNDSVNVTLKLLGLDESGGSDEYEIEGGTTQVLWTTGASDSKFSYTFDVKASPFIQLQAMAGTVGATAGDLTITINKIWK